MPAIIECGHVFVESGLAFVESGLVFVAPFCVLFIRIMAAEHGNGIVTSD